MNKQTRDAKLALIDAEWPPTEYPGMNSAMKADIEKQYAAANAPATPPPAPVAPRPAPEAPKVVSESSSDDSAPVLSPSEERVQARKRIDAGILEQRDVKHMTIAETYEFMEANPSGAFEQKESTATIADIQAEKVIEDPIDIDRAMRNAAQRRADAAWADRLSDRQRELVKRGIPADAAQGIAEQQIAAERLAAGEAPVSGVAQAEADVRKAFDALPKADQ